MKDFKEKLALVPTKPGSYQMKNKDGVIIYVGKAKNLKNRLKSYFTGTVTGKTLKLVEEIDDFEYIVTNSEMESFILEINLIKKYSPKYNILLKDDKTYPYIEEMSPCLCSYSRSCSQRSRVWLGFRLDYQGDVFGCP